MVPRPVANCERLSLPTKAPRQFVRDFNLTMSWMQIKCKTLGWNDDRIHAEVAAEKTAARERLATGDQGVVAFFAAMARDIRERRLDPELTADLLALPVHVSADGKYRYSLESERC